MFEYLKIKPHVSRSLWGREEIQEQGTVGNTGKEMKI